MAAAAGQDGLLTLDEPASETLAEWKGDAEKEQITLRQLLSMTGGQASTVGRPQGYLDSVKAPLAAAPGGKFQYGRSEEHTSELQSLMRISYAVFCLKKHIEQ